MALVVIGGVAAGLSAAARARRLDPHLEIVVLEKGPVISYGACGLPYFVEGRVREPEDLVVYTPEYFRSERKIDVRTGRARGGNLAPAARSGAGIRRARALRAAGDRDRRALRYLRHRRRCAAARLHAAHAGGCRHGCALSSAKSSRAARWWWAPAISGWKPPTRCAATACG